MGTVRQHNFKVACGMVRSPPFHILRSTGVNEPLWEKVDDFKYDPYRDPFGAIGCTIKKIGAFALVFAEPHLTLHLGNSVETTSTQSSEGNVNYAFYTGDVGVVDIFPTLTISPVPQSRAAGSGISPAANTAILRYTKPALF